MRTSTAYNHLQRLTARLHDAYHFARLSAWTHSRLLERLQETVWNDAALAKCPSWVREMLTERSSVAYHALYRPALCAAEYERNIAKAMAGQPIKPLAYVRHALRVDGVEYASEGISALRANGDEDVWLRVEGAMVWNHRPDRLFSDEWKRTASQ